MKTIYKAATLEEAEANLVRLEEAWGDQYDATVRSGQNNGEELSTFFEFPQEIRRLIYTTHSVESYHSKSAL